MPRRPLQRSHTLPISRVPPAPQSGVIPYRRAGEEVEILLITSSRRRRWTIPKGYVKTGLSPVISALEEAWEEGGIRGIVSEAPVGHYLYTKRALLLSVEVFSLRVEETHDVWPERWKRRRVWMPLAESIEAIEEPGLRQVLDQFGVSLLELNIGPTDSRS